MKLITSRRGGPRASRDSARPLLAWVLATLLAVVLLIPAWESPVREPVMAAPKSQSLPLHAAASAVVRH